MQKQKRFLKKNLILAKLALVLVLFFVPVALAQNNFNPPSVIPGDNYNVGGYGDQCIGLANMIRQGTLTLRQISCFIKYISELLIAIAGSVSVIFVMVGGYNYVLGSEGGKDEAKKTITYALIGLAVTLLAWIMVDIVLQFATS